MMQTFITKDRSQYMKEYRKQKKLEMAAVLEAIVQKNKKPTTTSRPAPQVSGSRCKSCRNFLQHYDLWVGECFRCRVKRIRKNRDPEKYARIYGED